MDDRQRVAVLGGGIAGLSTAYYLRRMGISVTLFEESERPGGVIQTRRDGGFLYECGPNTIQPDPRVSKLIDDLDLSEEVLDANPVQRNRFVVRDGVPLAIPTAPAAILRSPLFSLRGKLRILAEPFVGRGERDETVASFVRRRVGQEFLDYAINPFVAGVYAGDPEFLMMRYAFPQMAAIEEEHGSLVRGVVSRKVRQRRSGHARPRRRLISFRNGMETLPQGLTRALQGSVRLSSRVTALEPTQNGWAIRLAAGLCEEGFAAVVSTIPLYRLRELGLDASSAHPRVTYPPVTVAILGYERAAVGHPLNGFGVLVPAVERRFAVLGMLFSSSIFPDRAPTGAVLLTIFLGGTRHSEADYLGTDAAADVAHRDASTLLAIKGNPNFQTLVHWSRGIPQYDLSYAAAVQAIHGLEQRHPGLFLAGNFRGGISVVDTIGGGQAAADRVASYLRGR